MYPYKKHCSCKACKTITTSQRKEILMAIAEGASFILLMVGIFAMYIVLDALA